MDGFIDLFVELIIKTGIHERHVFRKKAVELPGERFARILIAHVTSAS